MKSQKGLTDEIFVLPFAILLILAAVAIPNFFQARDRAKRTACVHDLKVISEAMQKYESKHHSYPVDLSGTPWTHIDISDLRPIAEDVKDGNLNDCAQITFLSVTSKDFTISAVARDRNKTLLTATQDAINLP